MELEQLYRTARRATVITAIITASLAFLKILLGTLGHSQALLADGIHSFADLFTSALVLFAAKIGVRRPDQDHPYGHRRVETLATVILSLILISVAVSIAYDGLHRIFMHEPITRPSYYVIIVAVISILANELLYHYAMYEGNKIDSDLLRSNAWHNRSDALVSVVVLVSIIGSLLGAHYLDAIGAIIISILIFMMAFKLIWRSIKELIDTGVEDHIAQDITQHILQVPGVDAVHQLRTRSHGKNILLDVHIEVDPKISISEGHYISEKVNLSLLEHFEKIIDVTVHIDPEEEEYFIRSKDLPDRKTILNLLDQRWHNIPSYSQIEKTVIHYLRGKLGIEIYLPLSIIDNDTAKKMHLDQAYQNAVKDVSYISMVRVYLN